MHSFSERFLARNATLDMDNPTYGTGDLPAATGPRPPPSPRLAVYEDVSSFENHITETDLDQNYDVIHEDVEDDDTNIDTNRHNYDSVVLDDCPDFNNYDTVCDSPPKLALKPSIAPTAAYAVSDISSGAKFQKKVEYEPMNRATSLEGLTKKKNGPARKPVPSPKPKISGKPVLTKSASASTSTKTDYSQLNPASKYACLEPHITASVQIGPEEKTENQLKSTKEYSHLNH